MQLPSPLLSGTLIRRYKRFLADVRLEDGSEITAHCPNSGSMRHLIDNHPEVYVSRSGNPKRKLAYTLELIRRDDHLVMAYSAKANTLVAEAIESGVIEPLQGFDRIRTEVPYGAKSRVDLLLEREDERCFVEVKSVTLLETEETLMFPDSVTTRGQKHLKDLMDVAAAGDRAVIFFAVLHTGGTRFCPADAIDPEYGRLLRRAIDSGVEAYCYQADITPHEARLVRPLPIQLDT